VNEQVLTGFAYKRTRSMPIVPYRKPEMSFDYDKLKKQEEDPSWWTSYADLWSMLSVVFLVMYVATSLRSGTQGVQQQIEQEVLQTKVIELEEQLRVYATLRDETLQESSLEERKVYEQLMGKLTLLQEDAKDEKDELRRKAQENEEKEEALNQYQRIVRNIIDTNMLAKASIQSRDQVIKQKKSQITKLNQEVAVREQAIAKNEEQIIEINEQLEAQINKLQNAEKHAKISTAAMNRTVDRLREESQRRIEALKAQSSEERAEMSAKLEESRAAYAAELEALRADNQAKLAAERKDFEGKLAKQRLSAAARAKKLEEFGRQADRKAAELEGELSGLAGKVRQAEGELKSANAEKARTLASLEETSGQLKQAQDLLSAKKKLIDQIKTNFAKNGIKADVDAKTGDVMIDFGEEYFESGRAELKPGMVKTLQKMIPSYSKSLFENKETSEKIASVEIIGFASSTYRGKYVNPSSLKAQNQEAINYNMKLSFSRANSIFKQIFDPKKMSYENQKRLLPMVKVVGRGFLPEGKEAKDLPEDMPESEFCKKYNCNKAQKVIIKFNLKE
jgi:hypothetical protein